MVAIIDGPTPANWNAAYPWAAGRGTEIMERVAAEAIRQKASSCRADLDPHSGTILLRR